MRLQDSATRTVLSLLAAVLMCALWTGAQNESQTPLSSSSLRRNGTQQAGRPSQEPEISDSGTFVFHKQVEEVVLHATLLDENNVW
jgi:hypothetical protein